MMHNEFKSFKHIIKLDQACFSRCSTLNMIETLKVHYKPLYIFCNINITPYISINSVSMKTKCKPAFVVKHMLCLYITCAYDMKQVTFSCIQELKKFFYTFVMLGNLKRPKKAFPALLLNACREASFGIVKALG